MAPRLYAMNEFFYELAGAHATDRVNLLLELYNCYKEINPAAESLDDFIFWGEVILSDFDDVDKYLVDPDSIFTNVKDFKEIQDTYSYLSESQLAAIEQFVGHFKTGGRYKDEFRRIWDMLLPVYRKFNENLSAKGLSYEGMVYRSLAARVKETPVSDVLSAVFPDTSSFVFVGLNALNECEKTVMGRMRDARLARFCWDYSSTYIKNADNKSSLFLSENVLAFPQEFEPDPEGLPQTHFNVLSVPSATGQAKQIPEILRRTGGHGIETAVVLPDENQLISVLNSIPVSVDNVNVTMGYPMNGSEIWALMSDIAALQMHLRETGGEWMFYHKQVWSIFSNSIVKSALTEDGTRIAGEIKKSAKYYIPAGSFCGDPVLEAIFRPVAKDPGTASASVVAGLEAYQTDILVTLANILKTKEGMAIEIDFAKVLVEAVARLSTYKLEILPATYFRLLSRLAGNSSVPFKGEPLKGLQVMGPLETRALDFDNLIIMNCNEGVFPHRSVSSSFIPPELRKGFSLPTYEYQDAVWAYYFYRMIQRATNVWLLLDSRTEGLRCGEESRYIKQLELHFKAPVTRWTAKSQLKKTDDVDAIEKTAEEIASLKDKHLSASALQNYLSCPAKFYYHTVCGLKPEDEVSESLDAGMLGNVFHETMHILYTVDDNIIRSSYLKKLLDKDDSTVKNVVRSRIMEELHSFEVVGRNILFEDIVCRYVRKVLQRDIELMQSYGKDEFRILGLELPLKGSIDGFKFIGYIDRLDSFDPDEVRVVDYKTGKVTDKDVNITEDNAEQVVSMLFGDNNKERPKIALQLYLYDRFIADNRNVKGRSLVNSIYQTSNLFVSPVENVALNDKFCDLMDKSLRQILKEISDPEVPFSRTADDDTCKWCDFKAICGR